MTASYIEHAQGVVGGMLKLVTFRIQPQSRPAAVSLACEGTLDTH